MSSKKRSAGAAAAAAAGSGGDDDGSGGEERPNLWSAAHMIELLALMVEIKRIWAMWYVASSVAVAIIVLVGGRRARGYGRFGGRRAARARTHSNAPVLGRNV